MRIAALIVALLATGAGFFVGIPATFLRGAALFYLIPPYFVPVLSLVGLLFVYFRPWIGAAFLALSALATASWPMALFDKLKDAEQVSSDDLTFRIAIFSVPSVLAGLAALLALLSHNARKTGATGKR